MSLSTFFGLIFSLAVFLASVLLSLSNPTVLIDYKSLLIVAGGTAAVSFICFPIKEIASIFRVYLKRLLGNNKKDYKKIIEEIGILSKAKRRGKSDFNAAIEQVSHPFLKEGAEMLFWGESNVTCDQIRELLETRAQTVFKEYLAGSDIFKTIAKFPPAFGLLGTTLGMIALLQSLGGNQDLDNIGPAMAVALITTFYGVALANFIFTPIAENLSRQTHEDAVSRQMIIEALILIYESAPTRYVEEMAASFLLPGLRTKIMKKEA